MGAPLANALRRAAPSDPPSMELLVAPLQLGVRFHANPTLVGVVTGADHTVPRSV